MQNGTQEVAAAAKAAPTVDAVVTRADGVVERLCTECGNLNAREAGYCKACGSDLAALEPEPMEPEAQLRLAGAELVALARVGLATLHNLAARLEKKLRGA